MAAFDDGGGPALYAGGEWASINAPVDTRTMARYSAGAWRLLPGAPADAIVTCMAVFDDGTGEALYFGGDFGIPGHSTVSLLRWDGVEWTIPLPNLVGFLEVLTVFDDGSGAKLLVGGRFRTSPWGSDQHLASWDGGSILPVGGDLDGRVEDAVTGHENGIPVLYVCGTFNSAGGVEAKNIARWDGTHWSAIGEGLISGGGEALAVFDDGEGAELFVTGDFNNPDSPGHQFLLANWDGREWRYHGQFQDPENSILGRSLAVFDDGSGPALWIGGTFLEIDSVPNRYVARWREGALEAVQGWLAHRVNALAVYDEMGEAKLFAGGDVTTLQTHVVSEWDADTAWGIPGSSPNGWVRALTACELSAGPLLVVGGEFDQPALRVASWDGVKWAPLAGGGFDGPVHAMTEFDDGSGLALFATGSFTFAGELPAKSIARWDGSTWNAVGSGLSIYGRTLAVHDDGSGPALYAGGFFSSAGGVSAKNIAKWDGAAWSPLGLGLNNEVLALASFDDGSGPALFAGGQFINAGGQFASRVAKWQNGAWHAVGSGLSGPVDALVVFDDGSGAALYAGGNFIGHVARWDGESWEVVGGGATGRVHTLSVIDDGSGPALFAGGAFTTIGGQPAERLAKWDGASWEPVAEMGLNGPVYALAPWSTDGAPSVFAGGAFTMAGDVASEFVAEYRGCEPPLCVGDIDGDGFVGFADLNIILSAFNTSGVGLPGDVDGDGDVDFADLNAVVSVFNTNCAG